MTVAVHRPRAIALAAQADRVVGWFGELGEDDFDGRVGRSTAARGGRTVRDVAAQLVIDQDVLLRALGTPSLDEARGAADESGDLARLTAPGAASDDLAARTSGLELAADLRASMDELLDTLHRTDLPAFVAPTPPAHPHALATPRLLALHTTVWVLHALDLTVAGQRVPGLDPRAVDVAREVLGELPHEDEAGVGDRLRARGAGARARTR